MNEDRIRALLRDVEVPGAAQAHERGLATTLAAFGQRRPAPARPAPRRIALAVALATLAAAALLSPAGAAVRDWIGEAIPIGAGGAEPALTEIPGGGTLLVESKAGPWVVRADGSRRLLGNYATATWSPRGLYVAAAEGRTLTAIEPDGTPRWSITAPATVLTPRWSPSGFRIAFRSGGALRVVAGDGGGERTLAPRTRTVAPAWWPLESHVLAFVDDRRQLVVVEGDTGAQLARAPALPGTLSLSWRADGQRLLEVAADRLRIRSVAAGKLGIGLGQTRLVDLGRGAVVGASFSPVGDRIAAIVRRPAAGGRPARSEVVVLDSDGAALGPPRYIQGGLSGPTWSPDGRRLLIGRPDADRWLFVPVDGAGRAEAVSGIAAAFAPGDGRGSWPRVEGWCCAVGRP